MAEQSLRIVLAGTTESDDRRRAQTVRLRGGLEQALGEEGSASLQTGRGVGAGGGKGDPVTLGVIVVALISSGAVTKLIEKLFDHVKRERDEVEVSTESGTKVTVRASDLEDEDKRAAIEDTIRRAVAAAGG